MLSIVMHRRHQRKLEENRTRRDSFYDDDHLPARKLTPSKSVPSLYPRRGSNNSGDNKISPGISPVTPRPNRLSPFYAQPAHVRRRRSADMRRDSEYAKTVDEFGRLRLREVERSSGGVRKIEYSKSDAKRESNEKRRDSNEKRRDSNERRREKSSAGEDKRWKAPKRERSKVGENKKKHRSSSRKDEKG